MTENAAGNPKPARDVAAAVADVSATIANAAANTAASAATRGPAAMQENSRVAIDAVRQGGQATADVARRAGEAGAETLRRSADVVAVGQRQIAQEAANRIQDVSRTMAATAHGTAEDVRALLTLPTVADRGLQDLHHGISSLVQGVVQSNLRMTQELFRLTSPTAFIEVQQRFVRDYMNALMEGSAALVRAVQQTAAQTLPPLEQHLRQRAQNAGSSNNTMHRAAAE